MVNRGVPCGRLMNLTPLLQSFFVSNDTEVSAAPEPTSDSSDVEFLLPVLDFIASDPAFEEVFEAL